MTSTNHPAPTPEELFERLRLWRQQSPGNWYGNRNIEESMHMIKEQATELAVLKGDPVPVFFVPNAFGYCPHCDQPSISREKRPNGNDECKNGHRYPTTASIETPKG